MRSISERDLAVVIPLLAVKIRDLGVELRPDELTDEEIENRMQLQETLQQYDQVLEALRTEYEAALADGINLLGYGELTGRFHSDPA
jgi:hypothetical protein